MFVRRPVRVGRPGLIGTAARTAVIAGTAQAVTGNVARRQQARAMQQQDAAAHQQQVQAEQAAAYQQQVQAEQAAAYQHQAQAAPAPPPAPPAAAPAGDMIEQLERLAALKSQGILTEQEFAAQKARILGS